jgi:hypothetical protein
MLIWELIMMFLSAYLSAYFNDFNCFKSQALVIMLLIAESLWMSTLILIMIINYVQFNCIFKLNNIVFGSNFVHWTTLVYIIIN